MTVFQKLSFRWLAALMVSFLVLISSGNLTQAADALAKTISYSLDGKNFSSSVGTIFPTDLKLVPGDKIEKRLWLRNERNEDIQFSVVPVLSDEKSQLEVSIVGAGMHQLEPDEKTVISLQVELPRDATNYSQDRMSNLMLDIKISESVRTDQQGPDVRENLATTGFEDRLLLMTVGIIAMGVCFTTINRRRTGRVREGAQR